MNFLLMVKRKYFCTNEYENTFKFFFLRKKIFFFKILANIWIGIKLCLLWRFLCIFFVYFFRNMDLWIRSIIYYCCFYYLLWKKTNRIGWNDALMDTFCHLADIDRLIITIKVSSDIYWWNLLILIWQH